MTFALDPPPPLAEVVGHAAALAPPADDGARGLSAERFARHHRLGKSGVVVMLGSLGALAAGSLGFTVIRVSGDLDGCDAAGVGLYAVALAGAVGFTVGEAVADRIANPETVETSPVQGAAGLVSLAGFVCGAVQLANMGATGRREGLLAVVPTAGGAALVASF